MNTWNPRQEIISAAHRWYWITASFLLGVFLGWMLSFIWPAPYQATIDLYVGLNTNRATRDLYFAQVAQEKYENLDDYKHWQMSQLNSLVMSDEYLEETLRRLQDIDQKWQNYDVPALRKILSVAWRNTGEWHFSALTDEPDPSVQVVSVWIDVVLEKTNKSINAAEQLIFIDSELYAVAQALVSAEAHQTLLLESQQIFQDWVEILENKPADQLLSALEHWGLLAQVAAASDWSQGWSAVLAAAPSAQAFPGEYLDWLIQVKALVDAELALLPSVIETLTVDHTKLTAEYTLAADQSRALSANLEVAQIKDQLPIVVHQRSVGTLMLVGGLMGVLTWMMGWLVQITRKTSQ